MLENECARCHACQGSNRAAGDTSHDEPPDTRPAAEQEIPYGSTDTAGSGSRADRTADHSSDGESNEPGSSRDDRFAHPYRIFSYGLPSNVAWESHMTNTASDALQEAPPLRESQAGSALPPTNGRSTKPATSIPAATRTPARFR